MRTVEPRLARSGRVAGHIVAVVVNLALLVVVRNLLDWDVWPALTPAWNQVVPAITTTLLVTIVVHLLQMVWTAEWFRIVSDGVAAVVSCYASFRVLQVFPFEFDQDGFRWDLAFRGVLIVAIAGSAFAVLAVPLRLLSVDGDRPE